MSDQSNSPQAKESKTSAGAAGVGGGTLLVVIASNLPDNSKIKPWLIWASPSVSVFLGGLWLWLQVKVANYIRDREVRKLIDNTRNELEKALKNSKTSAAHRARIREKLEKLELVVVDRHMERVKSLKTVTEEDIAEKMKSN